MVCLVALDGCSVWLCLEVWHTAAHVIQTFNDTLEVCWRCWTYYGCCTQSCKLVDDEEKPWGWRFTSIFACQCFWLWLWCSLYHLVRYLRKIPPNGKTHSLMMLLALIYCMQNSLIQLQHRIFAITTLRSITRIWVATWRCHVEPWIHHLLPLMPLLTWVLFRWVIYK
jgi:hypothetical protein